MSDMNNNDKNKKNDDNDPFNFFKFSTDPKKGEEPSKNKKPGFPIWAILLIVLVSVMGFQRLLFPQNQDTIPFSEFKELIEQNRIVSVEMGETYFVGYGAESEAAETDQISPSYLFSTNQVQRETFRTVGIVTDDFVPLLDEKGIEYTFVKAQNNIFLQYLFNLIIPIALFFLLFRFMRKMSGGIGGSIFSAGQSKAAAVEEGKVPTRFTDVAGVDEAKEELVEVVDFLKSPQKYTEIGGKIPKGVLLVGPPGTGKTLLARAVAGEAGVPFFRISGSEFVEMFVGVGASRVRDLFKQAREKAPCIVFIDELDAIGKSRVNSIGGGGNDEREQTLNQLLVEMDGFDATKGLILLAATNRPEILDPAILRPGRFDRQVSVDRPDVKGREAILRIHAKAVKLGSGVDFSAVARTTSGMAGADLANIVNEAAILAVRGGRKEVIMEDFNEAVEKSIAGLQKKTKVIKESERRIVAYHETGHALVAAFTDGADPVHKISIIPRGIAALGYTLQLPEDDRNLMTQRELYNEIDVLLGGRAAEQITFGEVSTGAGNDIMRATNIARRILTDYGMSEKFQNVFLSQKGSGYGAAEPQLVREYSETTQQYIDEELARIMEERYKHVLKLLKAKKQVMTYISERLLEIEVIEQAEFNEIIKAELSLPTKKKAVAKTK